MRNARAGRLMTAANLLLPRCLLLVAGPLLLATVIACGGGGAAGPSSNNASSSTNDAGQPRLWIKEGEDVQPFENGDPVAVNGMNVEISVSPYPPGRSANIDFYVTRAGEPEGQATITLQYDMTIMAHGPFELLAAPTGQGHYLAPVDFAMNGDFWLNVALDVGDGPSVINMLVRAVR